MGLLYGIRISIKVYFVLLQFTRLTDRQTDGRTDGRTEISWLISPCIVAAQQKILPQYSYGSPCAVWIRSKIGFN